MSVPNWLQNFRHLHGGTYEERLSVQYVFASIIERWLDENQIKGNPDNEAIVQEMRAAYCAFCDWRIHTNKIHNEQVAAIKQLVKRLEGLC